MLLGLGVASLLWFVGDAVRCYGPLKGTTRFALFAQLAFWTAGGINLLLLAGRDYRRTRSPESVLLGLWLVGTFVFAAGFNWTVNGRSILPMAPPAAILLIRQLGIAPRAFTWSPLSITAVLAGLVIALGVAAADYRFAVASRDSAATLFEKYAGERQRFWYQGHWGFQYYLDSWGAKSLDVQNTVLQRGDLVATAENNCNFSTLGPDLVVLKEIILSPGPRWLASMKGEVGAGFYAASRGPLPFAFGRIPADRVVVCVVDPTTSPTAR
jgi:hypothetical protein